MRLKEEEERITNYLAESTKPKLLSVAETELIENHMRRLIEVPIISFDSI